MKRLLIGFVLLATLVALPSYAAVRRYCLVAYETRAGYSEDYKVEVTFVTGRELNKATKSFDYDAFDNFALIWFDKDQVAILKIDNLVLGVGEDFDNEDFRKLFGILGETAAHQVNAEKPRKWRIKGKDFMAWVDPRAE